MSIVGCFHAHCTPGLERHYPREIGNAAQRIRSTITAHVKELLRTHQRRPSATEADSVCVGGTFKKFVRRTADDGSAMRNATEEMAPAHFGALAARIHPRVPPASHGVGQPARVRREQR